MSKPEEPQRIAKLLARAGIASRREIERMIAERRIALNGVALETPATLLPDLTGVTVDGRPVAAPEPARLFRFHKPAGVLTAERDYSARRTIYDVLPQGLPRVIPVGRLDLNTEGLLLLTTDGELKRQLELPATQVPRTYRARAFGEVSQAQLEDLIEGIEIDGVRYGSIDANMERRTGANVWIEMTLTEGKNREVRRVLEHLGMTVSRLIRTKYGPIPLADMPVGAIDEVRQHDLTQFRRELRLPADKRTDTPLAIRPRATPTASAEPAASPRPRPPAKRGTHASGKAAQPNRPASGPSDRSTTPRRSDARQAGRADRPFTPRPSGNRTSEPPDRSAAPRASGPRNSDQPGRPAAARPYGNRASGSSDHGNRPDDRTARANNHRADKPARARPGGKPASPERAPRPQDQPPSGPKKVVRKREMPDALETDRKRLSARPPRSDAPGRAARPAPRGPARPPRGNPRPGPRKGPR